MNIINEGAWREMVEPKDINSAATTSSYFDMSSYPNAAIVINLGALNGSANDVTVELSQSVDVSGTDAAALAITRGYICSATGNAILSGTNEDGKFYIGPEMDQKTVIFDVRSTDFTGENDCIAVKLSDPGASWICGVDLLVYGQGTAQGCPTIGQSFGR